MKKSLVPITVLFLLLSACQDDLIPKKLSVEDQAELAAQDNAHMMIATQEVLDVTAGAIQDKGVSEGRVKQGDHDKYGCAPSINLTLNVDRNHPDSIIYSGTVIINYGDGSTCDATNKRMGKITDAFTIIVSTKNKLRFSSTETVTLEGFTRNNTAFNGVIITTSANGKKTSVEGNNVAIEYQDGTTSSWSGKLAFGYEDFTKKKGEISITGSISGTTRQAVGFTANISEAVVFKTGCFGWIKKVPVDGVISVTTNGASSTLDFGSGACDRVYTVTVDGESAQHTFN